MCPQNYTVYYSTRRFDLEFSGQDYELKKAHHAVTGKNSVTLRDLEPCETYFFKVRVSDPYLGPMSDVFSAKTLGGEMTRAFCFYVCFNYS